MDNAWFKNKKITLMGLGLHGGGVAIAQWLLKQGAILTITDLKTARELAPSLKALTPSRSPSWRGRNRAISSPLGGEARRGVRFVLGHHDPNDFKRADLIIQNPGVPKESPYLKIAKDHGVPITNEAKLFFQLVRGQGSGVRGQIIGITGTRGKSTTTALIAHILKRETRRPVFMGGNIRIPMFAILDPILRSIKQPLRGAKRRSNLPVIVLELSSWHCEHLDKTTGGPDVAVVTNLMRDHLNRYRSMKEYAAAKERIVRFQTKDQVAVLNKKNPWTRAMAKRAPGRVVWFDKISLPLQIPGVHNQENAAAAVQAVRSAGVYPPHAIRRALRSFPGLPYRLETIRTIRGVKYIDDTTATTPDATIAALRALSPHSQILKNVRMRNRIILIAGGRDKNLRFHRLAYETARRVKALVLLPGTATDLMRKELSRAKFNKPTVLVRSMTSAVRAASGLAIRGDVVLLSPGAASFGLFVNEFDRGDQFNKVVRSLK